MNQFRGRMPTNCHPIPVHLFARWTLPASEWVGADRAEQSEADEPDTSREDGGQVRHSGYGDLHQLFEDDDYSLQIDLEGDSSRTCVHDSSGEMQLELHVHPRDESRLAYRMTRTLNVCLVGTDYTPAQFSLADRLIQQVIEREN